MGKLRSINTVIWSDTWFEDLDTEEKLLFIYLITNEKTNMLGVYETSIKKMSFETGIQTKKISEIITKFVKYNRIKYISNRVVLLNFLKHQRYNTNMLKSAIDCYNELPNELKLMEHNTLNKDSKGFGTLLNHFGTVRKIEVEVEYKEEEEEEPLDLPEETSDVVSNLKLSQVNENTNVKNSKYYKITLGFRDLFLYNCKEFGIKNTKHLTDPDFIKFSNPIRLIIESDGYNVEDLRTVYDYLKNSNNTFWKKQVYSTSGLKEKFNKLIADAHAEQKQAVKTIKKPTLNI